MPGYYLVFIKAFDWDSGRRKICGWKREKRKEEESKRRQKKQKWVLIGFKHGERNGRKKIIGAYYMCWSGNEVKVACRDIVARGC